MKLKDTKVIENKTFDTKLGQVFIQKKLGKGKSGYSYLAEFGGRNLVLKLMHYETCDYYSFGDSNKVELEVDAFHKLKKCGIMLPELLSYDFEKNYLIKEYINGQIASQLISENLISELIIKQLFEMYHRIKGAGINFDYFPSNFVVRGNQLFYIDYECNPYKPEWNLPNWGLYYWANSDGFKKYLLSGDITLINESTETGIPIKMPLEEKVASWIKQYDNGQA